ncbi:hypothetical protein TRIP_D310290 [uncultured Paludibacter sp.]|nr:hypothetical protein TRIP_D310290 [uncultured Paludibacter sp.]
MEASIFGQYEFQVNLSYINAPNIPQLLSEQDYTAQTSKLACDTTLFQ